MQAATVQPKVEGNETSRLTGAPCSNYQKPQSPSCSRILRSAFGWTVAATELGAVLRYGCSHPIAAITNQQSPLPVLSRVYQAG